MFSLDLEPILNQSRERKLLLLILPTTALTSMTPPPVPVRRAAFLPTSLTDVAFFLQRDDSIAVAPVMNPGAPTRTHS